jgi:uncharacterized membrane protein YkoI
MNKYRYSIAVLVMVLLSAWSIAAQDNTAQRLTLLQALGIVQTGDPNLSASRFIIDGSYDADDACWKFEYSDTSEICISDTTGQLVDIDDNSGVPAPAATEDVNSGNVPAPAATEDVDIFLVQPTTSLDAAIATALRIFPNRIVSDFELEHNAEGVVVWEIKLDNDTVRVEVDAETGFVLHFGRNTNNDDDNSGSSGRGNGSSDSDDDGNSGRGSNNSGSSDSDNDDNSGSSGRGDSGRGDSGGSD